MATEEHKRQFSVAGVRFCCWTSRCGGQVNGMRRLPITVGGAVDTHCRQSCLGCDNPQEDHQGEIRLSCPCRPLCRGDRVAILRNTEIKISRCDRPKSPDSTL